MTVHCFHSAPPATLQSALSQFEDQFDYPLGEKDRFRIDHSDDYSRFFRAMGRAAIFVYEENDAVSGVLSCSRRRLVGPVGEAVNAVYLCDLKVQDSPRKGRILLRLLQSVQREFGDPLSHGYAVVMDGTAVVPSQYTGRLGIPAFARIAEVGVYNVKIPPASMNPNSLQVEAQRSDVEARFQALCHGSYHSVESHPELRSTIPVLPLMLNDNSACGILEDTELAKQLISLEHGSMCSAHLSQFAFESVDSGAKLVRHAIQLCRENERPRLFFSLPKNLGGALISQLTEFDVIEASATIFAHGLKDAIPWFVNTAEI